MTEKIIMPIGWLAGTNVTLPDAIQHLSLEMTGHAATLEERQEKDSAAGTKSPASQAYDLRRYGWAAWLIFWQLLTPEQKERSVIDLEALEELAERYNLVLPDDLQRSAPVKPAPAGQPAPANKDIQDLQILTVPEAAKKLQVSSAIVYRFIREGQLAAIRFGRSVRVDAIELEKFIQQQTTQGEKA